MVQKISFLEVEKVQFFKTAHQRLWSMLVMYRTLLAYNKRSLSNNGNNGIQIVFVDEKDIEVHCEKKSKLR